MKPILNFSCLSEDSVQTGYLCRFHNNSAEQLSLTHTKGFSIHSHLSAKGLLYFFNLCHYSRPASFFIIILIETQTIRRRK